MVENLVSSYKCPFCAATNISENNIDIIGAAGNAVNIDMHCPSCKKHFMAKTEIVHMEVGNMSPEKISSITNALSALKGKLGGDIEIDASIIKSNTEKQDKILDKTITDMQKDMQQNNLSASDLFSDNQDLGQK